MVMYSQYVSQEEYEKIVNTDYGDTFPHCNTTTFHSPGICPYCDSYYRQHPDFHPVAYATPEANGWGGNIAPIVDDQKALEEKGVIRKFWERMTSLD